LLLPLLHGLVELLLALTLGALLLLLLLLANASLHTVRQRVRLVAATLHLRLHRLLLPHPYFVL
jgi:hypothetical protein